MGVFIQPEKNKKPNRLISEKSPYLLQHAFNPVDWYPWGDEAFAKAKSEGKPIFLSIGYASCHWCHQMNKESFEDPQVSALLNDYFVSIKVDYEERPDINHVYMKATELLTGCVGWPLTIIMTADQKPFFAGTYFPCRGGAPGQVGLQELLDQMRTRWRQEREDVEKAADDFLSFLKQQDQLAVSASGLTEKNLGIAFTQLKNDFDARCGGFGRAPKFPMTQNLLFLLRYWKRAKNPEAKNMVEQTLQALQQGGIYDHLGFGFHRYSTDREWFKPHFEKMLCDQALLAYAYIEAYQLTRDMRYRRTAQEIFEYCIRDMLSPLGVFYSSEDADTEGQEGTYYLWSEKEIRQILTAQEAAVFTQVYEIVPEGNVYQRGPQKEEGLNILAQKKDLLQLASEMGLPESTIGLLLETSLKKLYHCRQLRKKPCRDDKILTDYNGLMIAALAKGAQVFEDSRYLDAAVKALNFIFRKMTRMDGRILHRYRDGQADIPGFLDDYASLLWGIIELYEATFEPEYLEKANVLANHICEYFWDEHTGGFYFAAKDDEPLLVRLRSFADGAIPSGGGIAIYNLLRFGNLIGDDRFSKQFERLWKLPLNTIKLEPSRFIQLMIAFDFTLGPSFEIIVDAKEETEELKKTLRILRLHFAPHEVVVLRRGGQKWAAIDQVINYRPQISDHEQNMMIYVCMNRVCKFSTSDVHLVIELLDEK